AATKPAAPAATAAPAQPAATVAPAQPTAAPAATKPAAQPTAPQAAATSAPAAQTGVKKLNLNTASATEFRTVPNVGNNMVREFNEYRPYSSILQFRKEIGKYVNAAQVADYEKYVYVPIKFNNADADTLQQMPGVDKTIAAQLIAARPYASKDAFLKKMGELVSPEQLTVGASYVE
ncbi:MAG: helix-hairpin-helix domain-containing protein, partial [Anaerolineae bacterium]|nr:helix-hairpin-helix domain-containing protein [Anaerolineae bacterium]